jgi:hypothetical protein
VAKLAAVGGRYTLGRDDWSIIALWALLLVVVGGALVSGLLNEAVQAMGSVLAATITGAVVLLGAILTHTLTELREQRMTQQREMQRNYSTILTNIADVIRKPSSTSDDFSRVHLESWVLGSRDVIRATQALLESKDPGARRAALEELVLAMRRDVGLPAVDGLKLKSVFGPRDEGSL